MHGPATCTNRVLCAHLPFVCPVPNGPWPSADKGLGTPDLEGGDSSSLALV